MSVTLIALIILLGILLILIELLIIPGITVAGVAGVLLIIAGVFFGYKTHGLPAGNYILLSTLGALLLLTVLALKLKTWQRFGLESTIDGKVAGVDIAEIQEGMEGKTVSRLAPIGKARFGNELLEVRSDGGYIDAHSEVVITRISGNKIYVETKN